MSLFKSIVSGVVLASLLAATALAFQPASFNDRYEVRLPMVSAQEMPAFASITASEQVEARLAARYGGSWRVHAWNAHTGNPRWVYGTPVRKAAGIGNAAELERAAKQVVIENFDVLRADIDALELVHTPYARGKWAAHLQQTWEGYEVHQGVVRLLFHENGNLMVMGSNFHPHIDVEPDPTLSAGAAADVARRDLPFQPELGDSYQVAPELMVLPIRQSENTVSYHLVYRVAVSTAEPLGQWITHVDAHTGEVVWRYNDVHFDFLGEATHEIQEHTWCNEDADFPAAYLDLNVSGAGSTTTEADGSWNIAGGGATAEVTASLQGPNVRVFNYNGAEAAYSGTATAGEPHTVTWDDLNARQDERDVFEAVNRIHTFFQDIDPDFSYINQPINAYVNRSDGYCPGNAWWNGTINFCAAGGDYSNTGELQQVVEHEFGHGIQDALLGGTQGGEGLGEGNSDVIGILLTQESIIGRGFFAGDCVQGIRNADNDLQYPQDMNGSIHHDGQIIAGFHWDAMQILQGLYGRDEGTLITARTWHDGRLLLRPMNQPDQVFATFWADDDDGDPSNGTANYDAFAQAAENHNYDYPELLVGMFVYHEGAPYRTSTSSATEIRCTGASLGGGEVDPSSFVLNYRVDGGTYTEVPMSADGEEFVADVPAQAYGSVVEYYISARNTLGDLGTSPRTAPEALHYFETDESFSDEMELATAWTVGADDDNASTGIWERADPQPTSSSGYTVQLGDDHTPDPGTQCWVTGALAGSGAGSFDVDGGKTTLYSPVFDLAGGMDVQIAYWRYYSNNRGNAPSQDDWIVDISNDGGQTWTSVENTSVSNTTWQQIAIELDDYFAVPDQVQLRFVASDEGDGSLVEAMVDDFTLVGTFLDPTAADDMPGIELEFALAQNHPNPFNPVTTVSFSLDRAGPAALRVFDTRGRLVRTLVSEDLPAGAHEVTWRGDDEGGRPVASGVYFYRLEAGDQQASRRMLLVK
ncbi:T9SS type A sorting domain-containing protein [bacterium]|nr:T9SS type A sorting domain-containing protein [bacterium]